LEIAWSEAPIEGLEAAFCEICTVAVGDDGVLFTVATLKGEQIRNQEAYLGVRGLLRANISRASIPVRSTPTPTVTLETLLRRGKLHPTDASELAAFLMPMLAWKPADRPIAAACLDQPWLHAPLSISPFLTRHLPPHRSQKSALLA